MTKANKKTILTILTICMALAFVFFGLGNNAYANTKQVSAQEIVQETSSEQMTVSSITEQSGCVGKLEANDRLVSIKISDKTYEIDVRNDLIYALLKANKGDTVTVEYIRGIIKYSADITLG